MLMMIFESCVLGVLSGGIWGGSNRPIGEVDHRLLQSSPIARRLAQLEARTDARFKAVFDALRDLMTPAEPMKKRGIGKFSRSG